ncbi:helix-turn-helix transcriptional regulator [Natrialba aegyptia]|uniref:Uncharacterized protein n=1 Tax=Natrialba aegyptia DSM 13077 TaxID=1227491 RepID=M0AW17_9EURY|nr:helix-turn-helix domain-containing protein [Natrialba aegyptia]ELZ01579.1 hypothetical protein C480_17877 [Natrialba aegyptia DSM 13077]
MPERNPNRDDESGKYTAGYTDDNAFEALKEYGGVATTSEVAEEMDCARRTAYNKLSSLEENGRITSRKSGRTRLWQVDSE